MKLTWKDCLKVGISIFVLYLAIHYWQSAADLVSTLLGAALPLIIGCAVAYLLNILMSAYERRWQDNAKKPWLVRLRRPVCMVLAFLTLVAIVALIVRLIVPQLGQCIRVIIAELPGFMEKTIALAEELVCVQDDFGRLGVVHLDPGRLVGGSDGLPGQLIRDSGDGQSVDPLEG